MSKQVNVDFVTRQIEVDTDGKEHFISAAMAAKDAEQSMVSAQNAANAAEKIANDLGLVDEAVQTAVDSAEQASSSATTASDKAAVATAKADIATAKASEASTSAATATQKADAASISATNAAQSYTNADAIATQLTEYLSTKETLTAPAVDKTLLIEGAAADSKVVGELKSDLVNHEKHSEDVYRPINLVDYPYKVYENSNFENQGWEANRGKIVSGEGTVIILKVKPSTQYWLNQISNVLYNVVLYDKNMEFVALAFPDYAPSFNNVINIPDNVLYVGYMDYESTSNPYFGLSAEKTLWNNGKKNVLDNSVNIPQITDVENEIENVRADVNSIISKSNKRLKVTSDSLSSGNKLELNTSNIKSSNIISFRCDLSTLGTIKFGRGVDASWSGMFVSIDSQHITFYARENNLDVRKYSVEHGLNISTFINVTLNIYDDQSIKLIVNTISGTFTHDSTWVGRYGKIFVQPLDCTISNVELTYYSNSYDRKLWAFGDSYFDFWNQYVYPYDCKNTMFDSFGGRTSIVAMDSLNECLKYGKPKQILWCMGMNDPDSSSAVNANWKIIYDRLVSMCETNDIDLILCTIPSTNTYNHSFKNQIIKNSGLRYVDICNAMGADVSTDWFSGFKSSDDIHPTTLGAKSIASRMMVDVPEMLG